MMKPKRIVVLISCVVFLSFISASVVLLESSNQETYWPFPELGPGLIQDSYSYRSPILETPFGLIGDIPGGYSIYRGSPLFTSGQDDSWKLGGIEDMILLHEWSMSEDAIVVLFVFAILPIAVVVAIGRSSYGRKKAQ